VISGSIKPEEEVVALPSMQKTRIRSISTHRGKLPEAIEGEAVVVELSDNIDLSRGEMLVRTHNLPHVTSSINAVLCWMDDRKTFTVGARYLLQHGPRIVHADVRELLYKIDVNTLHRQDATTLELNEIGRTELHLAQPIFTDAYHDNRANGGFVLIDPQSHRTVAAGVVRAEVTQPPTARRTRVSPNVRWDAGEVTREDRERRNEHNALVVWLTGLPGSGKSLISKALERELFDAGMQVTRLDGDNIRHGLSGDLGFSATDRAEHIRRVAEVAKLFFEAGHIVICSFISPYTADRAYARTLVPEGRFIETYLECDVSVCRERDPKGLYKKAEAGELSGLTGVDAPYEAPTQPELTLATAAETPEESVRRAIEAVRSAALGDRS
jgi:bifunctional enzyme CysN/CysC